MHMYILTHRHTQGTSLEVIINLQEFKLTKNRIRFQFPAQMLRTQSEGVGWASVLLSLFPPTQCRDMPYISRFFTTD